MDIDIVNFLKKQTVATIACNDDSAPYCFHCFYAINADEVLLYYKSSAAGTNHSRILGKNKKIAGTIQPDKLKKILVQGIQFEGELLELTDPLASKTSAKFYKKHPMALATPGEVWTIRIDHIKMTDNTKGFGTKIEWNREK